MSRPRRYEEDLAYGDIPQRWDRDRFERLASRPPARYEEDFRFTERERPGRRDVFVAERSRSRGPRGRFEEEDRFVEEERQTTRPRRRTDRELFGDVDPKEFADMAMTPYRKSVTREELDIDQREPRPGLLRRQSSLDTFDRRPSRVQKDEYRMQPYAPVPLPFRRHREEIYEPYYEPEDYREVEIQRERSVHRRRPAKSQASRSVKEEVKEEVKSVHERESSSSSSSTTTIQEEKEEIKSSRGGSTHASTKARSSRAPSVRESIHESSFNESINGPSGHESIHESAFEESVREERKFKKGKTRMPKRLVRREAVMDLGYPFDEEENFIVLRIALEKEQIDEVIRISETYKDGEKKKIYRFDEEVDEKEEYSVPPPPIGGEETITRTEWINPPSAIGSHAKSIRASSPSAKSSISRRLSPGRSEHTHRSRSRRASSRSTFVEERRTVIDESRSPPEQPYAPSAPRTEYYRDGTAIIEERVPEHAHHHHHHHPGSVVLAEREHRSDRDLRAEIHALEAERRALRFEREGEEQRDLALRLRDKGDEELQVVEYRNRPTEVVGVYERERESSPARNVVRVEKDRKGRMALVRSAH